MRKIRKSVVFKPNLALLKKMNQKKPKKKIKTLSDRSVILDVYSNPEFMKGCAKICEDVRKWREDLEAGRRRAYWRNYNNRLKRGEIIVR